MINYGMCIKYYSSNSYEKITETFRHGNIDTKCFRVCLNRIFSVWCCSADGHFKTCVHMFSFTSRLYRVSLMRDTCHQTANISHTLVGNKIVDHSDVLGTSPVGAAPTTPSILTWHMASMDWTKTFTRRDEKHFKFCDLVRLIYIYIL